MKKMILLGSALYLLTSFPASAQYGAQYTQFNFGEVRISPVVSKEYPHTSNWNRQNNHYQYWNQARIDQGLRNWERAREEARDNDHRDNGHHYAYGKNHPKHYGKGYGKNHPKSTMGRSISRDHYKHSASNR